MPGKYPTPLESARLAEAEGNTFEARPRYEEALRADPNCYEAAYFLACYRLSNISAQDVVSSVPELRDAWDGTLEQLKDAPEQVTVLRAMTGRLTELAARWMRTVDFSEEHYSSTVAKDRQQMQLISERRRTACMDLLRHAEDSLAAVPGAEDILHEERKAALRIMAEHPKALPGMDMRKETRRLSLLVNEREPGAAPEVALPSRLGTLKLPVMGALFGVSALCFILNYAVNWQQTYYAVLQGLMVIVFDVLFFMAVRARDGENKMAALSCASIFAGVEAIMLALRIISGGFGAISPMGRGVANITEVLIGGLLVLYAWKGPFPRSWPAVVMAAVAVGFLVFHAVSWNRSVTVFENGLKTLEAGMTPEEWETPLTLYRIRAGGETAPLRYDELSGIIGQTDTDGAIVTVDTDGDWALCSIMTAQAEGTGEAGHVLDSQTDIYVQTVKTSEYLPRQRTSFLLSTAHILAFDLACAVGFLSPYARKRSAKETV